jgi:protein-tyrosine phosphatase
VNVRDLGGLPTDGGGVTRTGVVVRSDDIAALSPSGWQALADYGVRTAVDLRFPQERTAHPPHASPIAVVEIPLFGRIDRAVSETLDRMVADADDAGAAIRLMYVNALEVHMTRIGRAVDAVAAGSAAGAVLVHCAIGKDRTGIVSALLLRLGGVSIDDVADDYALSHERVSPLVDEWIRSGEGEAQQEVRRRFCSAPREGMIGMLEALEERHGGAAQFLHEAGVGERRLDEIRSRLVA